MIIKVLFAQRKESYEGEFAPEALVVVDEFTHSENPDWFKKECGEELAKLKDEVMGYAVVDIDVDQGELRRRCLGLHPRILGVIQQET